MIGIISKPSHCKTHLEALRDRGLDAVCLGGDKTVKVPKGTRIVVLRTASCSHRASAIAFKWKREGNGHLIVENGLSGILRNLQELNPASIGCSMTPTLQGDFSNAFVAPAADQQVSSNPASNPLAALEQVKNEPSPPKEELMPSIPLPGYVGGTLPSDKAWSRVYTERNIRKAYVEALETITSANHRTISSFVASLKSNEISTKVKQRWKSLVEGNPVTYAFIALMLSPDLTKKQITKSYKNITGKGMDTRLTEVVGWALGWLSYEETPAPQDASLDTKESNTEAILDLMVEVAEIRETLASLNGVDALAARIKTLEDSRNTQGSVASDLEARIESRIKAMELDVSETLRQAMSGNPLAALAALEQVKTALKAAGFTGTLTLTIE